MPKSGLRPGSIPRCPTFLLLKQIDPLSRKIIFISQLVLRKCPGRLEVWKSVVTKLRYFFSNSNDPGIRVDGSQLLFFSLVALFFRNE